MTTRNLRSSAQTLNNQTNLITNQQVMSQVQGSTDQSSNGSNEGIEGGGQPEERSRPVGQMGINEQEGKEEQTDSFATPPISSTSQFDIFSGNFAKFMESHQRLLAESLLNRIGSGSNPPSYPPNSSNTILFGENYRQSLGIFPVLKRNNKMEYVTWVSQVHLTLSGLGLSKLVTGTLEDSFNLAVDMDGGRRSVPEIFAAWKRVHSKACVSLQLAIQPVFGLNLINTIRSKQGPSDTIIQVEQGTDGRYKLINTHSFIYENAYYFWKLIEQSITFSMYEAGKLLINFVTMKYVFRSDPVAFKAQFELMRTLLGSLMQIPDTMLKMIWFSAIPNECESLRQGLSARGDALKWEEIYEAILENYHQNSKGMKLGPRHELGLIATTSGYKGKPKNFIKCDHCSKPGHTEAKCWEKHPELRNERKPKRNRENDVEFQAPAIEIDELSSRMGEVDLTHGEFFMKIRERSPPNQVFFIFDSAATSHMVNDLSLLSDTRKVPAISVATAIRGQTTSITTRGTLLLNDQWKLTEVAYVKNGTANLISEGRICEAGFSITKDKNTILIVNGKGRTCLEGHRYNRLWIIGVNGVKPALVATNQLKRLTSEETSEIRSAKAAEEAARVESAKTTSTDEQKIQDPDLGQVDLVIPSRSLTEGKDKSKSKKRRRINKQKQ